MARERAPRERLLAGALPGPLRAGGRADAQRPRHRRGGLHLRGQRDSHQHRRDRQRGRVAARPLRLGVQGRRRRPRRRQPAGPRLPRRAPESAARGRERYGPHRGPHELHEHQDRPARDHARRPRGRPGRGAAHPAGGDARPGGAAPGTDAGGGHAGGRLALRGDRGVDGGAGRTTPARSRTSSIGCCSASSPRTWGCCRSAS